MKKKFLGVFAVVAATAIGLSGCGAMKDGEWGAPGDWAGSPEWNMGADMFDGASGNFQYESIVEQGFCDTAEEPSSYFSLDRNTASYSQVRAQINAGYKIASDSVRTEEMINYFDFDYPAPEEGEEMRVSAYLTDCPWNEAHKLATFGIRTQERALPEDAKNNYVFLLDVSGSMSARVQGLDGMSCFDLVKHGIGVLVNGLSDSDRVSIVTYASGVKEALEPTLATENGKKDIMKVVNKLESSGSTYGSGGINLAYEVAERYYAEGGNNRVILMTDGDFNVGISNKDKLAELIKEKAKSGIYLTVLGVGMGNMNDTIMQTLAMNGNGNYAYIDTPAEAEKALGSELNGMLVPVAKDAKAGVTFNADTVSKYRLLGYDMKVMSQEEFEDEEKDAGEIGSNLCVTAMYELELKEDAEEGASLAEAEVKYKSVETGENLSKAAELKYELSESNDLIFASCVMEFGLILRKSEHRGAASLASTLARLAAISDYLEKDIYKAEFKDLVQKAIVSEYYE